MESKVSWPFFSLAVTRSYFGIPGEGSAIGIQLFPVVPDSRTCRVPYRSRQNIPVQTTQQALTIK